MDLNNVVVRFVDPFEYNNRMLEKLHNETRTHTKFPAFYCYTMGGGTHMRNGTK